MADSPFFLYIYAGKKNYEKNHLTIDGIRLVAWMQACQEQARPDRICIMDTTGLCIGHAAGGFGIGQILLP